MSLVDAAASDDAAGAAASLSAGADDAAALPLPHAARLSDIRAAIAILNAFFIFVPP